MKRSEKSTSWLKGLTNSPIVSKLMRSHTTGMRIFRCFFVLLAVCIYVRFSFRMITDNGDTAFSRAADYLRNGVLTDVL